MTAITCDKYIEKYLQDATSKQRNDLIYEYYGAPEEYLCPDTQSFELSGSHANLTTLTFRVTLSDETKIKYQDGDDSTKSEIES